MRARWNPWRALRAHGDAVDFGFAVLPSTVHGRSYPLPHQRAAIEVNHRLDQVHRNYTLGHELVHVERRVWYEAGAPADLVAKEETWVDRVELPVHEVLADLEGFERPVAVAGRGSA